MSEPGRGTDDGPAPSKSRRRFILPVVIVLAIFAAWWAVQKFRFARAHESTDDAQVDGRLVPVLAKVGGFVREVRVVENQRVAAGAVLVRLDDAEYRARLDQAEADLAAAQWVGGGRGITGQAEAQVQSASSQREALDAQVEAALANQQKALSDLARVKDLVEKQIVSRQQLDALQATADAATANLNAVRRQAAGAGAGIVNAQAGARFAQARTTRRRNSGTCGWASQWRCRWTRTPVSLRRVVSRALARPPAPGSHSFRLTTRRGTSPKWCSVCRCGSRSSTIWALSVRSVLACRWWRTSVPWRRERAGERFRDSAWLRRSLTRGSSRRQRLRTRRRAWPRTGMRTSTSSRSR
jgi:hypothetical protein